METKRVYTFGNGHAEGKADMRNLLGGKGANLAEMNLIGVPVPPGFTITTEVCNEYFEKGKDAVVALLKDDVEKSIVGVEIRRCRKSIACISSFGCTCIHAGYDGYYPELGIER